MEKRLDSSSSLLLAPASGSEEADGPSPDTLVKQVFDRLIAALSLLALSPLLLMLALCIRIKDPGPVLFAHRRIGKGGKPFYCLKFRTMTVNADPILARHLEQHPDAAQEWRETQKLRNDPRVTPLGAMLRRTSLDELPQLINILKGDMSLVGPRPIVLDEVSHYGSAIRDYMAVRPGLTGLWQVSGRSDVGYRERVMLDQQYVRQRNFWIDIGIMLRTVSVVLRQQGSY